jgi:hypothetical protein
MRKFIFLLIILIIFLFTFFIPKKIFLEPKFSKEPILKENPFSEKRLAIYLDFFEKIRNDLINSKEEFLEVNLQQMKIKVWVDGLLVKEVPILRKGDPQEWGGTAAGLYKAISKNRSAFSVIAQVYMPYSINFYGKYYIHGEPYYPGGKKLETEASGGCIQLSDENAKTIFELTKEEMPVLVIDKEKESYQWSEAITEFPEISAKSYLVADLDSGFVFSERDSQKQFPIASITKLMTAIVVSENVDLRKSILVEKKMLEAYGSTKGLDAGKSFRVVELFYPLLIESSNDAAEVLSYFLGREKTIKLMNEKAKSILMEKTNFVDPSGFDLKNVSTAQDLFYLGRYILNNRPLLFEIGKGKEVKSFGEIKFDIKNLWNKNIFINDPSFVGGKTGYLKESGQTALFVFRFGERNILISLLNSENVEKDTQKIYKWLQENYFIN